MRRVNGVGHREVTVLQAGTAAVLGAALLGRSGMVGRSLARGVRIADRRGNDAVLRSLQMAQGIQGSMRRGTAVNGARARQLAALSVQLRKVPEPIRADVSAAAGALLSANVNPAYRPPTAYRHVQFRMR